jgi:hypothetical protein
MQSLNLPPISPKIKTENNRNYIFDSIRKTWVALTPEEWVRQHMVGFLVAHKSYPASLIQIEKGHKNAVGARRTDIVVCDKTGNPLMLVECKAPTVQLTQTTLEQVANYNLTLKARYILITNGINHMGFAIDFSSGAISPLDSIPLYNDL